MFTIANINIGWLYFEIKPVKPAPPKLAPFLSKFFLSGKRPGQALPQCICRNLSGFYDR